MVRSHENLKNYFNQNLPITTYMQLDILTASPQEVSLVFPLLPNINHKKTAFGGSLHSACTLACWSLVFLNLQDMDFDYDIVISHSHIEYIRPITTNFTAYSRTINSEIFNQFKKQLRKKGKSRITLSSQIYEDSQLCVSFTGTFVALKSTPLTSPQADTCTPVVS